MGVSQNQKSCFTGVERKLAIVQRLGRLIALEQPTVDDEIAGVGFDVRTGTSNSASGTTECKLGHADEFPSMFERYKP